MLATSKKIPFPGHNHLLTTGTDVFLRSDLCTAYQSLWMTSNPVCDVRYKHQLVSGLESYPLAALSGYPGYSGSLSQPAMQAELINIARCLKVLFMTGYSTVYTEQVLIW